VPGTRSARLLVGSGRWYPESTDAERRRNTPGRPSEVHRTSEGLLISESCQGVPPYAH